MTTCLLVNPAAGGGRAARLAPWVAAQLQRAFHDVDVVHTAHFQDADDALARFAASSDESDRLVVMGGDGMVHLGLNHVAGTPVRLAIVPSGTGNDFASSVGLPSRVGAAMDRIVTDRTTPVDLAEVTGGVHSGHCWVGCVVSTGYDAVVNRRTNQMTTKFGPLSYGWVALLALAEFSPKHYRISVDGHDRELDAMLIAVGNGGHFWRRHADMSVRQRRRRTARYHHHPYRSASDIAEVFAVSLCRTFHSPRLCGDLAR